jgi:hypothetical protein
MVLSVLNYVCVGICVYFGYVMDLNLGIVHLNYENMSKFVNSCVLNYHVFCCVLVL